MKDAFSRSEEFLDLEKAEDNLQKQKEETKEKLQTLTQEELELLQKLLQKIGCNAE